MSNVKTSFNGIDVVTDAQGQVFIDKESELTRLNYFDGKFLRAPDLQLEQAALLNQIRLSNRALGGGIEHGFSCSLLSGNRIKVSAGVAFDWLGRALVLGGDIDIPIHQLIESSQSDIDRTEQNNKTTSAEFKDCELRNVAVGNTNPIVNSDLYLIIISHVEAFCGEEDVYGKICSDACISDTQRTHIVEGVRISAIPLALSEPLKLSEQVTLTEKHARSRTVSAYFEQEKHGYDSLISGHGLKANTWCLGAESRSGEVAIAMLSMAGSSVVFLDAWAARRERMNTPAKDYWAMRLSMRSWQIYLAQILQFQCQLKDCIGNLAKPDTPVTSDPCAEEKSLLKAAAADMEQLVAYYENMSANLMKVDRLPNAKMANIDLNVLNASISRLKAAGAVSPSQQILIDCGIVELPSAGYLPVVPDSPLTINQQVRQLLGNGVDLKFCAVREDFIPHAVEQAQHMQRICLLSGLDNPENLEAIDILVPEGNVTQLENQLPQPGMQVHLNSMTTLMGMMMFMVVRVFDKELDEKDIRDDVVLSTTAPMRAEAYEKPVADALAKDVRATTKAKDINKVGRSRVMPVKMTNLRVNNTDMQIDQKMKGSARGALKSKDRPEFYLAASNAATTIVNDYTISSDINFWGEMRADKNVFSMREKERTHTSAKFLLEMSTDYSQLMDNGLVDLVIELDLSGQIVIETIQDLGRAQRLTGRFAGNTSLKYTTVQNGEGKPKHYSAPMNDTIIFTKKTGQFGDNIQVEIPSPSLYGDLDAVNIIYEQVWNAAGECEVLAFLAAKTEKGDQRQNIIDGTFVPDETALQPGSLYYNRSLVALNQISAALNDKGFVENSTSLLFPPPVKVPDNLNVTGSLPWVLFHRRRDKKCEGLQAQQPIEKPAKARSYKVYSVKVDEDVSVKKLAESVSRTFEKTISSAVSLGKVEYAANSQLINSSHDALQQAWLNIVGKGENVVLVAIASQGTALAEGDNLATARVKSANNILEAVVEFSKGTDIIVNRSVPTEYSEDTDGILVYYVQEPEIVEVPIKTNCHAVYHMRTENPLNFVRTLQEKFSKYEVESGLTLEDILAGEGIERFNYNPKFKVDSGEFLTNPEIEKFKQSWVNNGGYAVTHGACFYASNKPATETSTRSQTDTMLELTGLINGQTSNIINVPSPPEALDSCQRASLFVSATQCHDVYMVGSIQRDIELIPSQRVSENMSPLLDSLLESADTGWMPGQAAYYSLGPSVFYWNSPETETNAQNLFNSNWQQIISNNNYLQDLIKRNKIKIYSVIRKAPTNNDNVSHLPPGNIARTQGERLAQLMSIDANSEFFSYQSYSENFASNCPVVTFVIIDPVPDGYYETKKLEEVVKFDENNEVIRDDAFEKVLLDYKNNGVKVTEIESVAKDDSPEAMKVADAQARSLKKVLQDGGISTKMAKVNAMPAKASDKHKDTLLRFITK